MSTAPDLVPILANAGDLVDLPNTSGDGRFSIQNGFGLETETEESSGGTPPVRESINKVFNIISKAVNWFGMGGFFEWNSAIATGGGYPIRAIVKKADNSGYWSNTVDNNTSNPDTGGANWESISTDSVNSTTYATKQGVQRNTYRFANAGGTADAITASFSPAVTSLTNGSSFLIQAAAANTVSNPTLSVNGLAAKTIVKENNQPLEAGDILGANFWMELVYDSSLDKFQLVNPSMINFVNKNIFGVGQSPVDVTASRDFNVTYTNNTGKTIFVFINVSTGVAADVYISLSVNAVVAGYGHTKNGATHATIAYPIPDQANYELTATDTCAIAKWTELR